MATIHSIKVADQWIAVRVYTKSENADQPKKFRGVTKMEYNFRLSDDWVQVYSAFADENSIEEVLEIIAKIINDALILGRSITGRYSGATLVKLKK